MSGLKWTILKLIKRNGKKKISIPVKIKAQVNNVLMKLSTLFRDLDLQRLTCKLDFGHMSTLTDFSEAAQCTE